MNNYELFKSMINKYLRINEMDESVETTLRQASYSEQDKSFLSHSELAVVDMDHFARDGYRKVILPNSVSQDDTINTVDAFLINNNNEWYFVEFKDSIMKNSKDSVLKKAYSNVYAVLDVLYFMRETENAYPGFTYDSPIEFIRHNVNYICVFSSKKNPNHAQQEINHKQKREHYIPEFMKRLSGYIYHEAYAMSELSFENDFAKKFKY